MCGIAGVFGQTAKKPEAMTESLERTLYVLRHRGPDATGIYLSPNSKAGLASCRLSIRDLSPNGNMPMGNSDNKIWIVHNGEIYNANELRSTLQSAGYRFKSNSDTEVILAGYEYWGPGVVNRLRGMFAFAIYDEGIHDNDGKLILARDKFGIKPLYYTINNEALCFSSEIKGIFELNDSSNRVRPESFLNFLAFGSVSCPWTIYETVQQIEPATYSVVRLNDRVTMETVSYWQFPNKLNRIVGNRKNVISAVREKVEEAVKLNCISDAPIGSFLSGGIDSSIVSSVMQKNLSIPINTCSLKFDDKKYSEDKYSKELANKIGSKHHEYIVSGKEVVDKIEDILYYLDQPSIDGVNSYFVSKVAKDTGLTVSLSGLGGDELFGGYANVFRDIPILLSMLGVFSKIPYGMPLVRNIIWKYFNPNRWGKFLDSIKGEINFSSLYLARRGLFSKEQVGNILSYDINEKAGYDFKKYIRKPRNIDFDNVKNNQDAFLVCSIADLLNFTCNQLLRDTDVMSMAHSLEVRVPLLDDQLVEYVLTLPCHYKHAFIKKKKLLIDSFPDLLPDKIKNRVVKKGFVMPMDSWMRNELYEFVETMIMEADRYIFNKKSLNELWSNFIAGNVHWSRIWAVVVVSYYVNKKFVTF
ncbi:MAG: asparagine synthase (glutamine-hydrolyzing) [Desulfarculaceae bacterium]|nr:asparagine synthase (glutamine-hydrolyzing) [Desulfarculaceae bacterium]